MTQDPRDKADLAGAGMTRGQEVLHAIADRDHARIDSLTKDATHDELAWVVRHLAETAYAAVLFACRGDSEQARNALHGAADAITSDIVSTQVEIILTEAEQRAQSGKDPA